MRDDDCLKKEIVVANDMQSATTWKGNHILIEFPPMVANARVRLQMETPGCKSRGTVAKHIFTARKKNCIVEFIVLNGSF